MIKDENKRVPITLNEEAFDRLEEMAKEAKVTKSKIVCDLILNATIEKEIVKIVIK